MAQEFFKNREGRSGDWRCVVYQEPWNERVLVYLIDQKNRKIAVFGKDGDLEMVDAKEGESKPSMKIPYYAFQSILLAMGDVEPDIKREVVDSDLKATKYHLEDMRKLLKLNET